MTPSFASVYDDLVAAVAAEPFAELAAACREDFAKRVGSFSPTDPWFEERSAASWDRVLCDHAVLRRLTDAPPPAFGREHLAALRALGRAQRGLFEVHATEGTPVDLVCLVRGAAFRLAPTDDVGVSLARSSRGDAVSPGAIDARVVPTAEGVAVLPGILVHPAEATLPLREVIARGRELAEDDLLDALLAMRHRLGSLSRMKARQVYRAELLTARR
jgi:hypothetical protein